ncbi:MAG: PAS-domain containing protein [Rhodospirillum sp.]|nr:PAS-domain containing protein [Rhodospirillum sp.]MCF8487560.1 PAS-domain containing protein [Rhodospirillum sp.]MCF8499043.1 PAS-domain containing protein [Rhodospirillum sp.]
MPADPLLPAPVLTLAAGAVAVAAGWIALRWRRAWLKAEGQRDIARAEADSLRETLYTADDGYFLWLLSGPRAGTAVCSRRLAVLARLSSGLDATFSDLLAVLREDDARLLAERVARLRSDGAGFQLEVFHADLGRRLRVTGIRAAVEQGTELADLLWVRDVTDAAWALETLSDQVAALEADRDRLRGLLDGLPVPVWVRDDSLTIVACNLAHARALGLEDPLDAVEARRELASGGTGQEMRALAARARAAGWPSHARFHAVLAGERKLVEITETPIPSGPLAGQTVGVAQDFTALEEVEDRLSQETEAHGAVLERLGSAIAIFDGATRLAFHNAAFASLWRLDGDWLEENPSYGDFLERLREARRLPEVADFPAFKSGEVALFTKLLRPREDILHLPDGATLRRILAPHPLGGLLATYEDVTDSLAMERSYNQLTAVQRETLDHLHESVAVFGTDGRLRLSNPAFAALWGLDHPDDTPLASELVARLAAAGQGGEDWEILGRRLTGGGAGRGPLTGRVIRTDGRHLDYATVPLPDGGLLLSMVDITDRARVEQALRERTDALRAADRMKSEFIANVSFELRTPLTTVGGFAEILAEGYYGDLNPRQKDYAQVIAQTAGQVTRLIDDITDLASIDAGNLTLDLDAFDVHAALAAVLALVREAAKRRGITLHFDCPPDAGWIVADETRIKQVLYHLMANAITHSEQGGQVTLAVQREALGEGESPNRGEMVFTVADTGQGMDEAQMARAFDSFAKGLRSEGAGLGLTLVRRFVELHGGTIELISVPGEGTTITVRVPTGG